MGLQVKLPFGAVLTVTRRGYAVKLEHGSPYYPSSVGDCLKLVLIS